MMPDDKPNAPMTPREYVELIARPTLHEALAARDDRRRAYLACLVVCHVADSLGVAEAARDPGFAALEGRPRKLAARLATEAVQAEAKRRCGEIWTVVHGFANGTKHPARQPLLPGTEESVPAFALDTPGAGFDEGRWDVPGLAVHGDAEVLFLDACAQQVLASFVCAYPQHLGGIALRSFMDPGLEVLGLAIEPAWLTGIVAWAAGRPEVAELWLFEASPDVPPGKAPALSVGLTLSDAELAAAGGLVRAWAAGDYVALHEGWRSELAALVGGDVDLVFISRDGESGAQTAAEGQPRAILLWTRPAPTAADPLSLSTP
jgi:hypothetical protein